MSDSFVLLSSPFPREPGGGGREYGLLLSMKENGKRKPGGPAEGEERMGGRNRKQRKHTNSFVRARGILMPGILKLNETKLYCLKRDPLYGDGQMDLVHLFHMLFSIIHQQKKTWCFPHIKIHLVCHHPPQLLLAYQTKIHMSCSVWCVERKAPPCWEETVWPHLDGKYSSPELLVKQLLMNGCSPFLASVIERWEEITPHSKPGGHRDFCTSAPSSLLLSPFLCPPGGRSQQQHHLGNHLREMKSSFLKQQAPSRPPFFSGGGKGQFCASQRGVNNCICRG